MAFLLPLAAAVLVIAVGTAALTRGDRRRMPTSADGPWTETAADGPGTEAAATRAPRADRRRGRAYRNRRLRERG
ncbi:hypothetical protein [Streptomyces sp. B3I8]|uniref:hypothetical protein n=1 Tax=Streptomyces sp. B3I8 TaxID=3042303 RepID=UPI0027891767|nr:hypothetical protein [Streptomyces sp. B3I8]MDQ0791125.1 hypothetical protein [Streptomyces sp. B3I8]